MADLKTMPESLRDLLNSLEESHEADLSAEEQLQQMKEANAVRLAKLTRDEQQKYFDKVDVEYKAQLRREKEKHEADLAALEETYELDKSLSEAAFAEKHKMSKKEYADKIKQKNKEIKDDEKRQKNASKKAADLQKATKKKEREQALADIKAGKENAFGKGKSMSERLEGFKQMATGKDGKFDGGKLFGALTSALSDMAKQLETQIDQISSYKGAIDTRLQGSKNAKNWAGSYWEKISSDITGIAGVSPLISQSKVAERVSQMVSQGIAFNVEQRAVLQELSGKIATTFNAANGTLLRLVRIQQQDTTAGRLGMESALTAFLNNMYETTEYMQGIADSVKGSLEEAMSLMSGENALSFEYQVQKWLGSLYSTGMSQEAVSSLGGVLGKLASGQIDAITNGGQGNLVVMAANQAGLSISDLMNEGLNANTTNTLLNAMIEYLAKIYEEAGDSKVIQQQMASVYGMTASDLKAAVNLAKSAGIVARDGLTYSAAMGRLNSMANSMYARTSIGEMMQNAWGNVQYSMAAGIANNPALYAMYKAAGLLDTVAGGISIPAISVMGNMVDLHTTVADLMRAGAMGGGILSSIGTMIASGGNGGITGSGILRAAGIGNNITAVSRGNGGGLVTAGGASVSESGSLIGNASGSDVQNKTLTEANDSSKAQLAEAVDETEETKLKDVHAEVVEIYRLLQEIADGNYTIPVDVTNQSIKVDADGNL